MNLTPINYQTNLNQNKSIMFGNSQKLIKHTAKTATNGMEKVVLPAVGTVLATLGITQVTSSKTKKDEKSLDAKVASYLDKIKVSSGNIEEYETIMNDLEKEPDSPEKKALSEVAMAGYLSTGVINTSQMYEKFLNEILAENAAKKAILESLNPNAKLDDAFLENAFNRFTGENELSPEEKERCTELLKSNAGIVEKMMTYKNKDGSQMFSPESIGTFFFNTEHIIKNDPARIFITLEGEAFNKRLADKEDKAHALWYYLTF